MPYSLDIDPEVHASIDVLPTIALIALAQAFEAVRNDPWSGPAVDPLRNPLRPVRNMPFGDGGIVSYLILPRDQLVHVLLITWPG